MDWRIYVTPAKLLLLLVLLPFLPGCEKERLVVISGPTMGTSYTVKLVGMGLDKMKIGAEIDAELKRINSLMSTYDEHSELSQFNRSQGTDLFPTSPELLEVLRLSAEVHDHSDGAFDVTVGPLVNLWGFGPDPSRDSVPGDEEVEAARQRTGFGLLQIGGNGLHKENDLYVDLSAIAKGYAVDHVALVLDAWSIRNYLVEIGGELRAKGKNDRGISWTIAVEKPGSLSRSVFRTIELRDMSMATSGDYRNYFEVEGERYSHTIDPRTGQPITNNVASVTVLAPSAAVADAYATAINVLGVEKGLSLARELDLAVLILVKKADGFIERVSPTLDVYLRGVP
ncbi:MAG: hypothetical protein CMQ19_03455 [Gammaproteobacteria bacterium]|jgi:thiamine biosynthesis lipoprotein|nr:hypothetical protein [Gammaproteobacteria bacterium]|tara:strand:+ start:99 stop:1121 length:1023 start_codon:yes stop_codon:yes gene_type:complete